MDSGAIIAVAGTLGGAVVIAIVTYVIQQRVAERQRKWGLEDEERHRQQALEEERHKQKHDLLGRKLDAIEEAVSLMANFIHTEAAAEFGLPVFTDESATRQKRQRLQEIRPHAWNAVVITGSQELKRNWQILSKVYWELEESGCLGPDGAKEASDAHIAIIKLLEEMRLQA